MMFTCFDLLSLSLISFLSSSFTASDGSGEHGGRKSTVACGWSTFGDYSFDRAWWDLLSFDDTLRRVEKK